MVVPAKEYLKKSFSQNSIVGKSFWSYFDKEFPHLQKEGVCSGLCLDYARHIVSHENTDATNQDSISKIDYIAKLQRKFTLFGKSSKNFINRIQSYQELQATNHLTPELEILQTNHKLNPLDALNDELKKSSVIRFSLSSGKDLSSHAIALHIDRKNPEIPIYKIFDPNYGEYETKDYNACGEIIKSLCKDYNYDKITAYDFAKFVKDYEFVKPKKQNKNHQEYRSSNKYLNENSKNREQLLSMQLNSLCEVDGSEKAIKTLLNNHVDPNKTNKHGYTALFLACISSNKEAITALLNDKKVDVNKVDRSNNTPLLAACMTANTSKNNDAIKALLNNKDVDVNRKNNSGHTPLIVACNSQNAEIVRLLLANPKVKIEVNEKTLEPEIQQIIQAAKFKQKIYKKENSNTDYQKEFNDLSDNIKVNLIKQVKLDFKRLSEKDMAENIKNIILLFDEDKKMEHFGNLIKQNCKKEKNLENNKILLDAFSKDNQSKIKAAGIMIGIKMIYDSAAYVASSISHAAQFVNKLSHFHNQKTGKNRRF